MRKALVAIAAVPLFVSACSSSPEAALPTVSSTTEQPVDPYKTDREIIAGRLASCKIVSLKNNGPVTNKNISEHWWRTIVDVNLELTNKPGANEALKKHEAKTAPVSWNNFTVEAYAQQPNQDAGNIVGSSGATFDIEEYNPHQTLYPATARHPDGTQLHMYAKQVVKSPKTERGIVTTTVEKYCGTAVFRKNVEDPLSGTWNLDLSLPPQPDRMSSEG